jgi:SOS-response transcriptional repressor LexA
MNLKISIGTKIRELRESKGYSQTRLGMLAFGYKKGEENAAQTKITKIENGKQNVTIEELISLSNVLDFSIIDFIDGAIPAPIRQPRPIPVISWVHAGHFADAQDTMPFNVSGEIDPAYLYNSKAGPHAFGLRVEDDSMSPRFLQGDIIIVDPETQRDNGSPCVVWMNGEVTFRLVWETETETRLQPLNDRYPDVIIRKNSRTDYRFIGMVVDMRPKM